MIPKEVSEALADMEKQLGRIKRAISQYESRPPRSLMERAEIIEANLSRFRRYWGL